MKIAVGSKNAAKLQAVAAAAEALFGGAAVEGHAVSSGVSDQPMSVEETRRGARARAEGALRASPEAEFGVGLEGGLERVEDEVYECGWMCVVHRDGRHAFGSTARVRIAPSILAQLEQGTELAAVVDVMTGKHDVRSGQGFMGVVTNGALPRAPCYAHGLLFAFAPFVSDPAFWK